MRLIMFFIRSPDIAFALLTGLIALGAAQLPQLVLVRVLFGFLFSFLASGYSLTRLLPQGASIPERLIVAATGSLLLLYPASVLTVLYEGQTPQAIFGSHLTHSLASLFLLSFLLSIFIPKRRMKIARDQRFPKLLLLPLTLYAFLAFTNLNRADVLGDEYDLGYQAYDLVDGIKAGRKAFTISFSGHPPLVMDIKHFSMSILQPLGLDQLRDWQFRVSEALVGLLTLVVAYALLEEIHSRKTALLGILLLSVNNYMVWMGRIFHREIYLTFFMTAAVYFLIRFLRSQNKIYPWLAGLALGASLLSKESAVILVIAFVCWAVLRPQPRSQIGKILLIAFLMFLPVIMYNIAAYLRIGYADVFFSNILGVERPGATPIERDFVKNLRSMGSLLWDINSPLVMTAIGIGSLAILLRKKSHTEVFMIIWVGLTFLFFALTAIRSYYFLFLMIPLIVLTAGSMKNLSNLIQKGCLGVVVVYSILYTFNTNIVRNYSRAEDIGGIDGAIIISHPLNLHYSLAARSWSEEVGFKRLQSYLDQTVRSGDCVTVSESLNPLAVRRYLGVNDAVREYYLGPEYPSRYPNCPGDLNRVRGRVLMVSEDRNHPGSLIMPISDHLGNDRFYLFELAKGNSA